MNPTFLPLSSFCVEWVYWDDFFFLCCQIEAECQEGRLGVCLRVCVYSALCVSVGYIEGAVLVHLLFKCVCVRVCVRTCVYVCYQGSSPSLNKPFVCLGCSLLWARCPPGCCLSALFESLIKALRLSPSAPFLSISSSISSSQRFSVICSLSSPDVAPLYIICLISFSSCVCYAFHPSSFACLSTPLPPICFPSPFISPSRGPLSFPLLHPFITTPQSISLSLSPSVTVCCDRDISCLW